MKFTLNYTFNDIYEAYKLNYKASKLKWILLLIGIFLLLINVPSALTSADIISIVFILLAFSLLFYPYTFLRINSYLWFKRSKNLSSPIQFEVNDKGVITKTKSESSITNWSAFSRYLVNDKLLALYRTSILITPIPRRSLKNSEDWNKLLELVKKNIKL